MDLSFTCPTCAWIFVTGTTVPVPAHPDYLLGWRCTGVGATTFCIDVRPDWKRAFSQPST